MGRIEDNRIKRKDTDSDPLNHDISKIEKNKKVSTDKTTIKDKQNKK